MSAEPIPVACTLTTAAAERQALEWEDLQRRANHVEAITGGARMRFPCGLEAQISDLVAREASCCAFLTLATEVTGDELVLDVTSPNPDARPVISMLAGLEIP